MQHPLGPMIQALQKLPSIGPKSSERLAFTLLSWSQQSIQELADALVNTHKSIQYCQLCHNICLNSPCSICTDTQRNKSVLCIVAYPQDIIAFSKLSLYQGLFHVLGGLISPLDGMYPDMLQLPSLEQRLATTDFSEIIIAISPTLEGDATTLYLIEYLNLKRHHNVTRLAFGLAAGTQLDYADPLTIQKSLEYRQKI